MFSPLASWPIMPARENIRSTAAIAQIERAIREATPPSPLKPGHNLLRNTAAIIMACLEKNPDRRPSMEQVARVYADSASLLK